MGEEARSVTIAYYFDVLKRLVCFGLLFVEGVGGGNIGEIIRD